MFDRIVILRTSQTDSLIDLATLAETLLFYDSIQLVLNRASLCSLLLDFATDKFDRLLERPAIKTSFWSQNYGTISAGPLAMREHNFRAFEIASPGKKRLKHQEHIEQLVERTLGRSAATKKRINRILAKMSFPRIAAQGGSLLDTTLLDRILKGWKLDQFVKGPLLKFVEG